MSRPARGKRVTLTEYERLPSDDQYYHEVSRGLLVREPRPGAEHSWIAGKIYRALSSFMDRHRLGIVLMEAGFRLADDPLTLRGPDVAFVAQARVPARLPAGFLATAPDLAIEVLSPSNRAGIINDRIRDYFDAGTSEVWIIQPKTRTAVVHKPADEIRLFHETDTLSTPLLPGFELKLTEVLP
ncbi:MAG: Uma2 family endonuclease [Longimicrobiales bacterium]